MVNKKLPSLLHSCLMTYRTWGHPAVLLEKFLRTPSPSKLRAILNGLTDPYAPDTSLKALIEQHRKVQRYCFSHGQPVSEISMVEYLVAAVTPLPLACGMLAPALSAWTITNPTVALQTFSIV
jgi:hypothetical protein